MYHPQADPVATISICYGGFQLDVPQRRERMKLLSLCVSSRLYGLPLSDVQLNNVLGRNPPGKSPMFTGFLQYLNRHVTASL
jgi:hypothetical protein